ncbi:WYL domain-containing protein [Pantoea ananatis]|uniref:WYL domain-containing protein n=1 Tax=Pantoea ananas TaxID=553 RepID=UPI0021E84374|nr:WYL domain-containing protein [Pantoea ananatis]MCV3301326.1 WYL domain-containing protein [Pantoea ananatis]
MNNLNELTHAVQERLEFIEKQLIFKGWVSRADLIRRFGIAEAAATRDFKAYKDLSGKNMDLNHTVKRYEINKNNFTPVFDKSPSMYINELKNDFFNESSKEKIIEPIEHISYLNMDVFSEMARAINNNGLVKIKYRSIESSLSERIIAPHSFFDTDIKMYVRAYDRKRLKFSDFMVNRVVDVDIVPQGENTINKNEMADMDVDWNSYVELCIVPHPLKFDERNKASIEMDLDMKNGCKIVSVRRSLASYWLNRWDVDCSSEGLLKSKKYQLFLKNNEVLNSIENSILAPGYASFD